VLDHATDMGLSSAVIQRDDHSPSKISTAFWLNLLMGMALFGLLLLAAPVYARWQGHPIVASLLIADGGKLIFQNAYFIPYAMMKRELRFKELSILRIVANGGSGSTSRPSSTCAASAASRSAPAPPCSPASRCTG
jgi:hypothetical protein